MTGFTYNDLSNAVLVWTAEDAADELGQNLPTIFALAQAKLQRDLGLGILIFNTSGSLSAGGSVISRPANCIEIEVISMTQGGKAQMLSKRSWEYVTDYSSGVIASQAKYWAEDNTSQVIVGPPPSFTAPYVIRYSGLIDVISPTNQSNYLSLNFPAEFLFAALEESESLLQDSDRATLWNGKYQSMLPEARSDAAKSTRDSNQRLRGAPVALPAPEVKNG